MIVPYCPSSRHALILEEGVYGPFLSAPPFNTPIFATYQQQVRLSAASTEDPITLRLRQVLPDVSDRIENLHHAMNVMKTQDENAKQSIENLIGISSAHVGESVKLAHVQQMTVLDVIRRFMVSSVMTVINCTQESARDAEMSSDTLNTSAPAESLQFVAQDPNHLWSVH